jgi:hypothetical protein
LQTIGELKSVTAMDELEKWAKDKPEFLVMFSGCYVMAKDSFRGACRW